MPLHPPSRVPSGTPRCEKTSESLAWVPLTPVHRFFCSCFGELALLYSSPRAATVKAVSACTLWVMQRAVYNTLKRDLFRQSTTERVKLLAKVPMISGLSISHRAMLADALEQVSAISIFNSFILA